MNIFIIAKYGNKINVIYFFIFPLSKRIRGCRHNTRLTYNRSMSGSIEAGVSLLLMIMCTALNNIQFIIFNFIYKLIFLLNKYTDPHTT